MRKTKMVLEGVDCCLLYTSYLAIGRVEDGWLPIMENLPENERSVIFMDYLVQQWMGNPKVTVGLWNVHGQRHRTNNVVESCYSKLNSIIRRHHPNVFLSLKR